MDDHYILYILYFIISLMSFAVTGLITIVFRVDWERAEVLVEKLLAIILLMSLFTVTFYYHFYG